HSGHHAKFPMNLHVYWELGGTRGIGLRAWVWRAAMTGQVFVAAIAASQCLAAPAPDNFASALAEPAPAALVFSGTPSRQEIFRARVFEEPLVPIGNEPSPPENASLA